MVAPFAAGADTRMMASKLGNWLRRNRLLLGAAVLVLAGVAAASLLIRSAANREDPLRGAEVGLVRIAPVPGSGVADARAIVGRGSVPREDLLDARVVQREINGAARGVEAKWDDPAARLVGERTRRTTELYAETLGLVAAGRQAEARRSLARLVASSERLDAALLAANRELRSEVDLVEREAAIGSLIVTGLLGAGMIALIAIVGAARSRRGRAEAEQEAVRRSERRLEALVRHGSDLIAVLAPDSTVLYGAGAVGPMLGFTAADLEGDRLVNMVHPEDVPSLLALCGSEDDVGAARDLRLRHRDGSYRTCEARATSLLGDDLWNGIVLNVWDVSQRKELEERLRHQAFHDGLTGLANRALFADRLDHALRRAGRDGSAVAVLLIDLDDFKSINDSLGHAAGDRLLTEVAERLADAVRGADTIARLGGDEFGVVIEESASAAADTAAAERIVAALAEPIRLDHRAFPVTASVGIARSERGEGSADNLVRDADLAMYSAKSRRKGTYAVYAPDMHIATEERLQLKSDLVHALEDGGQLELFYQPVVSLEGERVVGLEALLRWNHPVRGRLAPEEFVPLADETGAIVPIGRWVLREACCQAADWARASGRAISVGVNVSARQLAGPELVGDVRDALRVSGMPAESLVLEVSEMTLMRDVERVSEVLERIKELGVRIAIDDFGTGFSSLSRLDRLPVDILKVDREFAGTPLDRAEHAKLLRAVREIGNSLHLRTVAEGIETPEQLEEMRSLDYPLAQGFLFSRPLSGSAVSTMLAAEPGPIGDLEATGAPRKASVDRDDR